MVVCVDDSVWVWTCVEEVERGLCVCGGVCVGEGVYLYVSVCEG